jgi:hypothetical protein
MSTEYRPPRRRHNLAREEERAWVGFYQRVRSDAGTAAEVLAQLDRDPEMKSMHLALYLCCKESLRRHKARTARNQRIGQAVRALCAVLFTWPWGQTRTALARGRDLAIECLPDASTREPAIEQVRRLSRRAEIKAAQSQFEPQKSPSMPPADDVPAAPASPGIRVG